MLRNRTFISDTSLTMIALYGRPDNKILASKDDIVKFTYTLGEGQRPKLKTNRTKAIIEMCYNVTIIYIHSLIQYDALLDLVVEIKVKKIGVT